MQSEANRNVDQTKLAEALREILTNHQLPFRDRVKEITSNEEMHRYVANILDDLYQGLTSKKVVLCTKVVSAKSGDEKDDVFFELEYKDFQELFSQFGKLERMFFRRTSASYMEAICIFRDNVNAFIAQRLLDGYTLTEPNVVLDIKFLQEKEDEEEDNQKTDFSFHCKYEVTIVDSQFQTFRRLSGAKDCNILRLKDLASKESSGGDHFTGGDFEGVEVLLRNGDPDRHPSEKSKYTYLIINAKTQEKYTKAMSLSMELMANLYEEYKLFCDEKSIPVPYETRIKKYEFIENDCPLIFTSESKLKNKLEDVQ